MERMGLVASIEQELERMISLGKLPRSGFLPSEQVLARSYGVSRATAREVLLRLAARGLVVQHPGRRSRAVPLDEAVTLENLSVALHAEGPAHPERRRLLEGFFELKRELTVELLSACCEQASERDLSQLLDICFLLGKAAHWEEARVWAKREFELLRRAALAANRPGHFLLVQSLERSFWTMADRVLPHLDCEVISRWALRAFHALSERNASELRQDLPPLLQASDERLFADLAPAREEEDMTMDLHSSAQTPPEEGKVPVANRPDPSACQTSLREPLPAGTPLLEATHSKLPDADAPNRSACQTGSCQPQPDEAPRRRVPHGGWTEAAGHNRSACQTSSCQPLPPRDCRPTPVSSCSGDDSNCTVLHVDRSIRVEGPCRAHTWSPVLWGRRPRETGAASSEPSPIFRALWV
jgi:DNA-binding FadR family transcriptional regulator